MRRYVLAALTVVATISIAGTGGRTWAEAQTAAQPKDYAVRMVPDGGTFKFSPDTIEVKVGDTISWLNATTAPHTATADDGAAATAGFDTMTVLAKQFSKRITFSTAGAFKYHCDFHDMHGTVTVKP